MPGNKRRIVLLGLWGAMIAASVLWFLRLDLPMAKIPEALRDWTSGMGVCGPWLFIAAYAIRPLTILPASIPAAAAGMLWGPAYGLLLTLAGENFSAGCTFVTARWLGRHWLAGYRQHALVKRIDRHLLEHGVPTVLLMRLILLPFDITNFVCGLTEMRYLDYAIGTALGIVPGAVVCVLFGSAWNEPRNLAISAALFGASLVLAAVIKRSRLGHDLLEFENRASEDGSSR